MTTPNIEELRKLAEAASVLDHSERMQWYTEQDLMPSAFYEKNARFMAALTPPAVIELLDALQSQAERIKELSLQVVSAFGQAQEALEERDTLRAELAAIRATQDQPSNPVMKITVRDKDWTVDYLSLPIGEHELFTKNYVYNAYSAAKDAGLVAALKDAATSLETISRLAGRTHYVGDDGERVETYMGHHDQVRGYATSRASVARDALSKIGGV